MSFSRELSVERKQLPTGLLEQKKTHVFLTLSCALSCAVDFFCFCATIENNDLTRGHTTRCTETGNNGRWDRLSAPRSMWQTGFLCRGITCYTDTLQCRAMWFFFQFIDANAQPVHVPEHMDLTIIPRLVCSKWIKYDSIASSCLLFFFI